MRMLPLTHALADPRRLASPPSLSPDPGPSAPREQLTLSSATPLPARGASWKAALSLLALGTAAVVGQVPAGAETVVQQQIVQQTQLQETRIDPAQTDPAIAQARGPHLALVDPAADPNGYLLVSLGGTNSLPQDFLAFDRLAAQQGYSVVGLDYPNTVITTACKTSLQPDPCTLFRREIVSGEQVSDLVQVDQHNSIENRLEALLRYQAQHDPEHFADFIGPDGVQWEKIVVVGHSQGSGHAAFLAKKHPMKAAILLAGPQDTTAAGPASWLSAPSQTPADDYLSFLHQDDFFDSKSQLAAVRLLREDPQGQATVVDKNSSEAPVIMTTAQVRDPHMSVIGDQFKDVWEGLLRRALQ